MSDAKNHDEATGQAAKEDEPKMDEFAVSMFEIMGYGNKKDGRLPKELVRMYAEYKRRKDRLVPGRMSPEAFAFVATLYELVK